MKYNDVFIVDFFQYSFKRFPKLFYFFILFCVLQLFFILIKLQVMPFFLYGMYSEKIPPTSQFKTVSIKVNGKNINEYNISAREYEFLSSALESYINMKRNAGIDVIQTRVESRYPLLTNSPIYPFIKVKIFNPSNAVSNFESWFKLRCSKTLNFTVVTVSVKENLYKYNVTTRSTTYLKTEQIAYF